MKEACIKTFKNSRKRLIRQNALKKLRAQLKALDLDGFIVPHGDEFQNEYLPACNKRLQWLTGFSGSAGLAIILHNKAAIFIDGRYTLQVRSEVDLQLMEPFQVPQHSPADWIANKLKGKTRVGYDPRLLTIKMLTAMREKVAANNPQCQFVAVANNLVDEIWHERPAEPQTPVCASPVEI